MIAGRKEIASMIYVNQTHIARLLVVPMSMAHKIFLAASVLEDEKYGAYRIFSNRVHLSIVLKMQGIQLNQLLKQIEFEEKQKSAPIQQDQSASMAS